MALDPETFERKHVHEVYESIAEQFSATRQVPWPLVAQYLSQLRPGSLLLDMGCGNGRYLGNMALLETGVDRSPNLALIARHSAPVMLADIMRLPLQSGFFDAAISIAVIHHLATPQRRLTALRQLHRVLCPGGTALIAVWAYEQGLSCQDGLVPWSRQPHGVEPGNEPGNAHDRYYHFFRRGELSDLCRESGFDIDRRRGCALYQELYGHAEEQDEYLDHGNWYCVVTKR